jgi:hypothetical protein
MSKQPATETGPTGQAAQTPPPVTRAEQLMSDWGQNIGFFLGTARHRLQHTMTSLREEAGRMDQPLHSPPSANGMSPSSTTTTRKAPAHQGEATTQVVSERAEHLVDGFAQRVVAITAVTGLHVRRAGAFVREDAEDIWAEAQRIRNQRRHE